jgi:hypothetical protein
LSLATETSRTARTVTHSTTSDDVLGFDIAFTLPLSADTRRLTMDDSSALADDAQRRSADDKAAALHKGPQSHDPSLQQQQQNDLSVLDDSLLVEQGEFLHEISVTPFKAPRPPLCRTEANDKDENDDQTPVACLEVLLEDDHEPNELHIGDHVYQWRTWMGIPGVFQHHGIVMDIIRHGEEGNDHHQETTKKLIIADFSNVPPSAKSKAQQQQQQESLNTTSSSERRGLNQEGILRTYTDTDTTTWHKVHYQAAFWKRQVYRAGTCTSVKSDAIGLVLARVNFIIHHPDVLPDYHVVHANCECVAFWCKTGNWSTLQASNFLELTAAGQVKSTTTLAAMAANSQVTVPTAGLWGWFGYTSQVSWLSLHPMVMPALAGYAVVTVGVPAVMYAKARKQWKETSQRLCDAFWESAMEHPEVFAECMTHWSEKR